MVGIILLYCKTTRRPDYCLGPHLRQMLSYGCTRLEIGVQSTYEDVARDTNRGHTVAAVADCFSLSKDAGFKVLSRYISYGYPWFGFSIYMSIVAPWLFPHSNSSSNYLPHQLVDKLILQLYWRDHQLKLRLLGYHSRLGHVLCSFSHYEL